MKKLMLLVLAAAILCPFQAALADTRVEPSVEKPVQASPAYAMSLPGIVVDMPASVTEKLQTRIEEDFRVILKLRLAAQEYNLLHPGGATAPSTCLAEAGTPATGCDPS